MGSSSLLKHDINLVLIFHLKHLWSLLGHDSVSVEEESKRVGLDSLSLRISVKDLGHFGSLLDLEEGLFSSLKQN